MPIIAIPIELRRNFLANRNEFLLNLACWPKTALSPFYRQAESLFKCISTRENQWDYVHKRLYPSFTCKNPYLFRYMHFDLSENRDRCGFAMCHAPFHVTRDILVEDEVDEVRLPHIVFDFLGLIEVSKTEELDFQIIPDLVFDLRRRGFPLDLVTFDRFQSTYITQILSREGIHCGKLSIDRTAYKLLVEKVLKTNGETKGWKIARESTEKQYSDAHQALKAAVYEHRCSVPAWTEWVERHPQNPRHPFIEEALGAEYTDADTVDHGPFSKIDLLSGMAGAAYNCANNAPDLGDKPIGYSETKFYDWKNMHDDRVANFTALMNELQNVSSMNEFQRVMQFARSSEFSDVDTFELERSTENSFNELGW